ncbi:phytanoyl-CoA dioxygenase family protein [Novosphingobium sp. KA1]|uniref:phytanoyl-CoA dioxygenase family protein n=1 Tax=Novosphingobium sp. (strain KA1) TaxID=164608 RepID=UPI001A8F12BE|nr:phytanoyl-CoA dioxygenase family protein [Novosphingobium sp. KA1]QSR19303.1 hypothetical protein CA833_19185 [Novosphingobium sp. KA1]
MFTEPLCREAGRISTELTANGYAVLQGAVPAGAITAIDHELAPHFAAAPFESCELGVNKVQRIGRMLLRAPASEQLICHRIVLKAVEDILVHGSDTLQLNLAEGIARHPCDRPGIPFRDELMWRGADNRFEYLVNVVWPLTPSSAETGAIRIWPGSHGSHDLEPAITSAGVPMELKPGDALLYLGSTLYNSGANRSDHVSRSIQIGYCLGWLKPTENQWLAYPPDVARGFSPDLAALVGYRRHFANLGNFEGECPSVVLDPRRTAQFDLGEIPLFPGGAHSSSRRLPS